MLDWPMRRDQQRMGHSKIMRALAKKLTPYGFKRTKPSFFTRPKEHFIQFIHIHKFSNRPDYRIHLGLRVFNDSFDASALNGIDSDVYTTPSSPDGVKYRFDYRTDSNSLEACVDELAKWCREVGEPWFEKWSDSTHLVSFPDSPLYPDQRKVLEHQLTAGIDPKKAAFSRQLLKVI